MSIRKDFFSLSPDVLCSERLFIRPINDDEDLWYATEECRLKDGQEELVNRAGFSIGRAYLNPEDNIPCVICKNTGERIGYIVFRKWFGSEAYSWSYYLDRDSQGKGFGREAAILAVRILKASAPDMPIKLSTEVANLKAKELYLSIGFSLSGEMDGDDIVYIYN